MRKRKPGRWVCTAAVTGMVCTAAVFSSQAGVRYEPELPADNVLQAMTPAMTSGERLAWYLDVTGQEQDALVAQAKIDVGEEVEAILDVGGDIVEYVTQTSDNDFYLTHNAYGAEDVNGCVFFDARCRFFPQNDQIILHGHNMKGGAVFGRLNNYRDIDYMRAHPIITLRTLAGPEDYVLYAVTDVNVDKEAENYFKEVAWTFDPDSFAQYTGELIGKSYYSIPVDVRFGDRLLMLSTCSYVYSDSRLVLCARKLRADETREQMSALAAGSTISGNEPDDTDPYSGGGDYESLGSEEEGGLLYETEDNIAFLQGFIEG